MVKTLCPTSLLSLAAIYLQVVEAALGCLLCCYCMWVRVFYSFLFECVRQWEPDSQMCARAFMLSGFTLCCLPGFVVCFKVLTVSFSFPLSPFCFLSSPLPHPVRHPMPAFLVLGCWYFAFLPPQLSPTTFPPFSTPPAPSLANGPPSPKFGRDPLSYCLKEINKTVKPRISSFRTLRRSVSHQKRRVGCQESTHEDLYTVLYESDWAECVSMKTLRQTVSFFPQKFTPERIMVICTCGLFSCATDNMLATFPLQPLMPLY